MGVMAPQMVAGGWRTATPTEAGLAPDLAQSLAAAVAEGDFAGLHALLIVRHGRLAFESYLDGADECWGHPLDSPHHGPDLVHDVRSVTKSIVSLLYGIALADGLVPRTTARLSDALPAYADLADDPLRRRMTVGHTLSMRLGIAWDEDITYADPHNGERQMEAAADRYRYILGRPMASAPGTAWTYCGGATALLGHLIEQGTGRRLEDFASERLFAPLAIHGFAWIHGSDGRAAASSGLRLTARDLARIGQLILDRGQAQGRRIVPPGWLATSFKPRAYVESGLRYGYQWWLGNLVATGKPWFGAFGNGGQRLIVIPSLDMAVVIFAGNYNQADQWKMPVRLMSRIVMPAVVSG